MARIEPMTDVAEFALSQLALRVSDYRWLSTQDMVRFEKRVHTPSISRAGNAVTDLVAVAEHFSSARLLMIRPGVKTEELQSWVARRKAWSKRVNIDVTKFPRWQALMGFVEIRNALQHGLGRLTDRQLTQNRIQVLTAIAASGVALDGDLVQLGPPDIVRCSLDCAGFIQYLDNAAPTT